MPQLPVTCPRCGADLTVGREHLNRPVQCGACGKAFVPVADPGGREPDDLPPRKKGGGWGPTVGIVSLLLGAATILSCCVTPLMIAFGVAAVVTALIGLTIRDSRSLALTSLALVLISGCLRGFLGVAMRGAFDAF